MLSIGFLNNVFSYILNQIPYGQIKYHEKSSSNIQNSEREEDIGEPRGLYDELMQPELPKIITWKSIVMFSVCVQLGNNFTNWTAGLEAGFWPFIGIIIAILTSFGCEMLCIAEMTSALPFSGGTYGVVRVTLGDLPGYLLGTCEAFQYILYVAFNTIAMAQYTTSMTGYGEKYEPLYWLIMYTAIAALLTFRRSLFWKSMWVFGIYILVMILLYCTMTREKANFDYYTKDPAVGNLSDNQYTYNFFQALPNGSWFFNMAPKIMPLTCSETENPTMNVPKAMYIGYAISIMSAFAVVCCAVSISPGLAALRLTKTPLIFGFSEIFDITTLQALSFTLIAKFATCLPYAFAYSVLISSLSKSGFMWRTSHLHSCTNSHSYLAGIFSGSVLGYALNLMIWSWDKDFLVYLSRGYKILGYGINLTIFVTYIVFKSKFSTLVKTYESPVGIYGAIYGLVMFIVVFISIGALEDPQDRWLVFVFLVGFLLVWSAPYFLYYRHHLTYSEEESTIMFIAYVIKANQARRAQNLLTLKQRSKHLSPVTTPHRSQHSSHAGSDKSKITYVPTASRLTSEENAVVDFESTGRITPLCSSNVESSVHKTTAGAGSTEGADGVQDYCNDGSLVLHSVNATPRSQRCPLVQHSNSSVNSNNNNSMSNIPENRAASTLHIEMPVYTNVRSVGGGRENKVVPHQQQQQSNSGAEAHSGNDEQIQNRGVSALDSVLTKGLRYGSEAMSKIRTEIQEFYDALRSGQEDEEV